MGRARKLLASLLVVSAVMAVVGRLTYAAFSATTSNPGNSLAAGTVSIGDNDAGMAMLSLASANPGDSDTGCMRVTYTGSLDSGVRLYAAVSGSLAPYLNLTVTRGSDPSPSFDSCASFVADGTDYIGAGAGVVYSGALSGYPATYDAGVVDPPSGPAEAWSTSEAHSYRFTVTLGSDPAAIGLTATAAFTWEARNL